MSKEPKKCLKCGLPSSWNGSANMNLVCWDIDGVKCLERQLAALTHERDVLASMFDFDLYRYLKVGLDQYYVQDLEDGTRYLLTHGAQERAMRYAIADYCLSHGHSVEDWPKSGGN